MPKHHSKMLRGCDLWYADFPGLLKYSKLKDGHKFKDFKELDDRYNELDAYVKEQQDERVHIEVAKMEILNRAMMTQTIRRMFDEQLKRIDNVIDSFGKERDMAFNAREEFPLWLEKNNNKNEVAGQGRRLPFSA